LGACLIFVFSSLEIPTLLAPSTEVDKKEAEAPLNHPGAQVAATAAAIDDGLGAFRPSTSFNDLSTLLPPSAEPSNPQVLAPVAPPPTAPQGKAADGNKRTQNGAPSEAPAAKRRNSSERSNSSVDATAAKNYSTVAVPNDKINCASRAASTCDAGDKNKNDTPNPLTSGHPQASATKIQPVKSIAKAPVAAAAAVVIPRVQAEMSVPASVTTAPAPPLLSAPPTEADFKSVAQAAVSNLIMNAGCSTKSDASSTGSDIGIGMKIDTSTEHIKALTGTNWVAVCAGGEVGQSANATADKMNNRARRQNLTPDERARQNRDRNREHARNTRLRKKAYVEELKRTLTALVSQRDSAEVEKRHSAQR
jgi:hypothetical protein